MLNPLFQKGQVADRLLLAGEIGAAARAYRTLSPFWGLKAGNRTCNRQLLVQWKKIRPKAAN